MGTHPSSLPDETLRNEKAIDAIIRGEADETICGLADALSSGDYNLLDDKERVEILNKISGISTGSPEDAQPWLDKGCQFVTVAGDSGLLISAAEETLRKLGRNTT